MRIAQGIVVLGAVVIGSEASAQGWTVASNLTVKAGVALKESYDSNVYLQDTDTGVPEAFPAKKDSWVTTFTPRVGLDYKPCRYFGLAAFYAPDMVVYHNAHGEDHFTHRVGLTLGGKGENVLWEQGNSFTLIDGSHVGPIFGQPQEVPAIGGIPLRDRRDALVYKGNFKLVYPVGDFFLRPVGSAYIHDFRTLQQVLPPPAIYENYIDRQDVNGGLDLGYNVGKQTFLLLGYRYGQQDQYKLLGVDSPYDSAYHRILVGVEGSPVPWLKLALLGGPDLRDWQHATPPSFDRGEVIYWIDSTVTILPTKTDSIVLLNRRYEQPAFASPSVYEDITYSISWKHVFDNHWAANAGFQLYIGDWQSPVQRDDWIYTPSIGLSYTHDKHLGADLAYSYDWVESQIPNTSGREFTRHLVSLAVKYAF